MHGLVKKSPLILTFLVDIGIKLVAGIGIPGHGSNVSVGCFDECTFAQIESGSIRGGEEIPSDAVVLGKPWKR